MSAVCDLRRLEGDNLVVHFGGRLSEVDVFTYGRSLLEFSELLREINGALNPGSRLEVRIVADGPGSFRVQLRIARHILKNLWAAIEGSPTGSASVGSFLGAIASVLLLNLVSPSEDEQIVVGDDVVEIRRGDTLIILPREAKEAAEQVQKNPAVLDRVQRTFEVLEDDPSIESFGITRHLNDPEPEFEIQRKYFRELAEKGDRVISDEAIRIVPHKATLVLNKIWLDRSKTRKWQVVWNGFPVSVTVHDDSFFDRLAHRAITIRQGDALRGTLEVRQERNEMTGAWENREYRVTEVDDVIYPPQQGEMLD